MLAILQSLTESFTMEIAQAIRDLIEDCNAATEVCEKLDGQLALKEQPAMGILATPEVQHWHWSPIVVVWSAVLSTQIPW